MLQKTWVVFFIVICTHFLSSYAVGQTLGLVAAYNFNEGSGSTVTDLSGNNLTGKIVGATWTTGGKYGNALSFNGTSSYVDLGNPAALQLTGSITIEAWVKAAADPANDGQIVAKSDNTSGWQLKTSHDTGPQAFAVAVTNSSGARAQRYTTTTRALNTWYHVAGIYNSAAGTLDIYVNGALNSGALRGSIPSSNRNAAVNVNIGRRTGGYYFNGVIDEVRIYNRALSPTEIQSDMKTSLAGGVSPSDAQSPTTPANLNTSAMSSSSINLSWVASTDNVGVTGYRIERCQGIGCSNFVQKATSTGTTYGDSGLSPNTSYAYRVRATDAAGNLSAYSNTGSATTPGQTTGTPPPPTSGTLTISPSSLSFGNVTVGTTSSKTATFTASTAAVTISAATTTNQEFTLSGLTLPATIAAGKSVSVGVNFKPTSSGSTSTRFSVTGDATNSPAAFTASGSGVTAMQHTVGLTWSPSASSVVGYNIYRGTATGGPYSKINSSSIVTASYSDATVKSGSTYFYVTTAVNSAGTESSKSNEVRATIPTP
jgi:fibronectin type 3 domain-containing protein